MDENFAVAKESLKKFRLVRDLNATNDVNVTRLTINEEKLNSSVYNIVNKVEWLWNPLDFFVICFC